MILLTVASDVSRAATFLRSAEHRGFVPVVLGVGREYKNHADRYALIVRALDRLDGVVMFSDSYDAVVVGTPTEAEHGYRTYETPVVFSAERNCYPPSLLPKVPASDNPYRFLNAGGFVGDAKTLSRLYQTFATNPEPLDQATIFDYYLSHPGEIALDTQCRVFQCLYNAPGDVDYQVAPVRPINKLFDTNPVVIHGNGKSNLRPAVRWESAARGVEVLPVAGDLAVGPSNVLHLVTPCSRHGNLVTISKHLARYRAEFDFHWWVAIDPKLPAALPKPDNAHAFRAKAGGAWGAHGRNQCLDMIDDGWVAFLDDDTLPHQDFPQVLREAVDAHPDALGFAFSQLHASGALRVRAEEGTDVDTGTFVFRREAIGKIRWRTGVYNHDQYFFRAVVKANPGRTVWIDRVASWYNKLRPRKG